MWPDEIELRPHGGDQRCRVTWGGHGAERLPVPQASWFEVLRVAPGAGHMGAGALPRAPTSAQGTVTEIYVPRGYEAAYY